MHSRRFRFAGLLAATLAIAATGCGGGGPATSAMDTTADVPSPGGNGALRYAVIAVPRDLDPLQATGREQELVSLQLHEPLLASLVPPYGKGPQRPGLALSVRPSRDRTIWTANLRSSVRFHDGTPFNAAAVVANARRWASLDRGRVLLPGLFAADSPRPDLVRFQLNRPVPDFAERLAAPQLGIVAPESLRPRSGSGARVSESAAPGTGPFMLSGIDSGRIVLSRYPKWWGSALGLGPALDSVEFLSDADERGRLELLSSGGVEVADALPSGGLATVAADPLLSVLPGRERIGLSRKVRGIESAEPLTFSGVWLTTVGAP